MDDSRDAVYVEDKNARFDIIDENADSLGMKAEELLNACRTEYRFAVKENHGRYTVTQTVTYSDASGNTIGTPQTLTIFDSVLTGADLRSLYVCYIPALRTAGDMYRTQEKVVIENRQDIPVDVYLIRQGSQDTPLAVSIIAVSYTHLDVYKRQVVKVIPGYAATFEQAGMQLPGITRAMMSMSHVITKFWYLFVGGILLIVLGIREWRKTESGKLFFGKIAMKLPLFGKLNIKTYSSQFARTLSTLMYAGIPLIHGIDAVTKLSLIHI